MKKILFFALCVILASCQRDNEALIFNQETKLTVQKNDSKGYQIPTESSRNPFTTASAKILEKRMQWTSFITAIVLRENVAARNDFIDRVSGQNTVLLENLLGHNISNSSPFKSSFLHYLEFYTNPESNTGVSCPGGSVDDPGMPPFRNGEIGTGDDVLAFMNYILNDNCIEFYLPKPFQFNINFTIASTAHPLTSDSTSQGYIQYSNNYNCLLGREFIISPIYIVYNSNIIVARPIITNDCEYTEYSGIDFTDFLNI